MAVSNLQPGALVFYFKIIRHIYDYEYLLTVHVWMSMCDCVYNTEFVDILQASWKNL